MQFPVDPSSIIDPPPLSLQQWPDSETMHWPSSATSVFVLVPCLAKHFDIYGQTFAVRDGPFLQMAWMLKCLFTATSSRNIYVCSWSAARTINLSASADRRRAGFRLPSPSYFIQLRRGVPGTGTFTGSRGRHGLTRSCGWLAELAVDRTVSLPVGVSFYRP